MIKLKRVSDTPLLEPNPANEWEAGAVFNCAIIIHQEKIHMIYRATNITSNGLQGNYINSFGLATSDDGINFKRLSKPVLSNDVYQEARGPEDPRIVKIDDIFYMMYTGFGGHFDGDYRICLATSKDLHSWHRHGVVLEEPNKDASLFPEKINGKYWMFHRRFPDIWLAESDDLKTWNNHRILMSPIKNSTWESLKIGIAGPPIRTKQGWVLIYHGVTPQKKYSLGIALLDLEDPSKLIARQADSILEPTLSWELQGYVPNVTFSCGQVILGDELWVYYCGADTVINAAKIKLSSIKF